MKAMQARQVTCSRQCRGKRDARTLPAAVKFARSQKGGLKGAAVRRAQRDARYQRWVDVCHGDPLLVARLVYQRGYNAGRLARRYYELSDLARRARQARGVAA